MPLYVNPYAGDIIRTMDEAARAKAGATIATGDANARAVSIGGDAQARALDIQGHQDAQAGQIVGTSLRDLSQLPLQIPQQHVEQLKLREMAEQSTDALVTRAALSDAKGDPDVALRTLDAAGHATAATALRTQLTAARIKGLEQVKLENETSTQTLKQAGGLLASVQASDAPADAYMRVLPQVRKLVGPDIAQKLPDAYDPGFVAQALNWGSTAAETMQTRARIAAAAKDAIATTTSTLELQRKMSDYLGQWSQTVENQDDWTKMLANAKALGASPALLEKIGATFSTSAQKRASALVADPGKLAEDDQKVRSNAAGQLASATTADAYAKAWNALPTQVAAKFPAPELFDPTKTPAQVRLIGETPAQQNTSAIEAANLGVRQQELGLAKNRNAREQKQFDVTYGQGVDANGEPTVSPQAQAIANYRMPPVSARSMASGPGKVLMEEVMRANPSYDATQYQTRQKARIAFTTGSQGQTINSLNTAIGHLDQFVGVINALGNGNFQPGNQAFNWLKSTFGESAPTNFDGIRSIMSGELASAFKKSGATDNEIASVEHAVAAKNSPKQLLDYVQTIAMPALGSKVVNFDQQYRQVMGKDDPFKILLPESEEILKKHGIDPEHPSIGGAKKMEPAAAGPKKGDTKPIEGHLGTEQTFDGAKWIRTK